MENSSRSKNAIVNIIVGYIAQIAIIILTFLCRKVFLNYLTIDYLGINGLFTNILSVLSLAELGVGTVILYSLYDPVAKNDKKTIIGLLKLSSKIYLFIAIAVIIIGLVLVPFLGYLVKTKIDLQHVTIYYLLFLINTAATYISATKIAFLSANQDLRLQKTVTLSATLIQNILQIVELMLFKNFIGYLIIQVLCTIFLNISINIITSKRYPFLKDKADDTEINKKQIFKNITSTFLYKIGTITINNTDNILISVLVSTAAVGFYSNYYQIVGAVQGFIAIVTTALISGVGNLNTENDKNHLYLMFNVMLLFYHFVAALGMISFYFLFNDFITIWLGSHYLFDMSTVFAIVLNFYLTTAVSPVWMFREATGLFTKVKYLLLITAFLNIVLSILLGIKFGTFGILLATSIARLISMVWYEPIVLFKNAFNKSSLEYWKIQFKYLWCTIIAFVICYFVTNHILVGSNLIWIIIKAIIYFLLVLIIFSIVSFKSDEFRWFIIRFKGMKIKKA